MRARALGCQVGRSPGRSAPFAVAAVAPQDPPRGVGRERLELGGATTRASGPSRSSSRSSQAGSLTARTISSEPSRPLGDGLGRVRLGDPGRRGRELERHARVVGAGRVHVAGLEPGRARFERLPGRLDRADPVDAEHALVARAVAVRADVPLAGREEHDLGVDAPGRQLVAAGRPVLDLDALGDARPRRGSPRAGRVRRRRRRDPGARARPPASPSAVASGPSGSEPGTASSARPAASSARPSAGVSRSGRRK